MSDELENRLREIYERLEKATPGPWHQDETFPECIMAGEVDIACAHEERQDSGPVHPPDADFIAHSRSDIEFLLASLRARPQEPELSKEWLDELIRTKVNTRTTGASWGAQALAEAILESRRAPSGPLSDEPRGNQDGAVPVLGGEKK